MSKWEDKYNELSPKIDDMFKKQSSKIDKLSEERAKLMNNVNSNEYEKLTNELNSAKKERKRIEKLKSNLKQVSHIIEYRNELKGQLKKLKEEVQRRNSLKQAAGRQKALENKIAEYQERYEKIGKEIKEVNRKLRDLKPEEKDKKAELEDKLLDLEIEKEEITKEMPKAQDRRDKQEEILKQGLGRKTTLSELSQEEIDEKSLDIQNKISKCDLVANCLMNGLNWDSIDMKLDNWKDKKFTAKDDKLSKAKENAKKDTEKEPEQPDIDLGDNGIDTRVPAVKTTFADRHPRLAKIFRKIKNIFSKSKKSNEEKGKTAEELQDEMLKAKIAEAVAKIKGDRDEQKGEKEEPQKDLPKDMEKKEEEKKELEEKKTEKKPEEEVSFKEYIRQIAKKGIAEVEREQKEAREKVEREQRETRLKDARAKLAERQKANREAEEKKFGKEYAVKSAEERKYSKGYTKALNDFKREAKDHDMSR